MSKALRSLSELYEREERLITIIGKIELVTRFMLGVVYLFVISEITGIPIVTIFMYLYEYMRLMPSLLAPYRTQILLIMLLVDTFDIMFGNIMIREIGEKYVTGVILLSTILGFLTFFAYPSVLIFIVFTLPKILALHVILKSKDTVEALVHLLRTGSFPEKVRK